MVSAMFDLFVSIKILDYCCVDFHHFFGRHKCEGPDHSDAMLHAFIFPAQHPEAMLAQLPLQALVPMEVASGNL